MGEEPLSFNVGMQTGDYIVRVSGNNGASSATPYSLRIKEQAIVTGDIRTLILVNAERSAQVHGLDATETLITQLQTLAAHPAVQGILFFLEDDPLLTSYYAQLDDTPFTQAQAHVQAANRVANRIKAIVEAQLGTYSGRRYLVLVGDDRIIPHYRLSIPVYPYGIDPAWQRENSYPWIDFEAQGVGAAMSLDYTLTDDFYADFHPQLVGGRPLFVPDLSLGRLVETPAEMGAAITAFLAHEGQIATNTTVVTGYDFGADAAQRYCELWQQDGVTPDCTLIDNTWAAATLATKLLAAGAKVFSLFNHANHFEFASPQGGKDTITANDLAAGAADRSGSLYYIIGCQAGLNVPGANGALPTRDMAQTMVALGATVIGSTGWAYGVDDQIGYMEKFMALLTEHLLAGDSAMVGEAVRLAKVAYAEQIPGLGQGRSYLSYYDEKTLAETILYGLPMWQLQTPDQSFVTGSVMPATESGTLHVTPDFLVAVQATEKTAAWVADDALPPGVAARPIVNEGPFVHQRQPTAKGSYLRAGSVLAIANYPIQPATVLEFRDELGEPHGIFFEGGSYLDEADFDPVIAVANLTNQNATDHEPYYAGAGWYPEVPITLNLVPDLSGAVEAWKVSRLTGQYYNGTERIYDKLSYTIYFAHAAPTISDRTPAIVTSVHWESQQAGTAVTVHAPDESGIYRVSATWTVGNGIWQTTDLTPSLTDASWHATVPAVESLSFIIQVVDNAGNVTTETRNGRYYGTGTTGYDLLHLPFLNR